MVSPFVTTAPMRALLDWRPDWKTEAVGRILGHRAGTFVDVGANVGQSLSDFVLAPVRSTYVGFEPNLICYQHLAKLVADNALHQCHVVPAGLGDRNGIVELYRYGGDVDAGTTTVRELRPRLEVVADSGCVFRLDDIGDRIPEPEISLIKIDVEGSEIEVLRGMRSTIERTRPWILCEVLHRDLFAEPEPYRQRCAELMRLVVGMGYVVLHVVQDDQGASIKGLETVDAFPDSVWHEEDSLFACDYLFVPEGDSGAALELLGR